MERELAERIAATVDNEITVEQARRIIGEFLTQLARCPVCDGTGTITFGRDVEARVTDPTRLSGPHVVYIEAGTPGSCPRCGSRNEEESGRGDPAWVIWHCAVGDSDVECGRERASDKPEKRDRHGECGWRIAVPYEPRATTK